MKQITKTETVTIKKNIFEVGDKVTLKENWADVEKADDYECSAFWCEDNSCKVGMIYEVSIVTAHHNIMLKDGFYYLNPRCFDLVVTIDLENDI